MVACWMRSLDGSMLVVLGMAGALGACSGEAGEGFAAGEAAVPDLAVSDQTGDHPLSVSMQWGGGQCARDCWVRAEVERSGVLVVSDERGSRSYELETDEVTALWRTLESNELHDALLDPDACYDASGYGRGIAVTWASGAVLGDESALSCTISGRLHPYLTVYQELLALLDEHARCTAEDEPGRALCRLP